MVTKEMERVGRLQCGLLGAEVKEAQVAPKSAASESLAATEHHTISDIAENYCC